MGYRKRQRAITMIEFLVVAGIIAAFFVLVLLPQLTRPRTPVRRFKCVNNLKNVGLAF
ncbi:MAG: type II secretion system protein [Verrucomicrobia bacterium]|nr:type II secretion system protein [Verrucomicrobiota bacterium]